MNCPVCGDTMETKAYRKVEIDVCQEHGVWLDRGELETIDARHRERLRRKARLAAEQRKNAKRRGKCEGMVFGWLSFLWD